MRVGGAVVASPLAHILIIIRRAHMFITNRTLTAVDYLFSAAGIIEDFDYVKTGERIIHYTATIAAVIVGIITYAVTALQLFWLEHSETIIITTTRFMITLADFTGDCYHTGRKLRPVVTHNLTRLADTVFFKLAAKM